MVESQQDGFLEYQSICNSSEMLLKKNLSSLTIVCASLPLPKHKFGGCVLSQMRDLYGTIRNFRTRVSDFIRYRRVTTNMNEVSVPYVSEKYVSAHLVLGKLPTI